MLNNSYLVQALNQSLPFIQSIFGSTFVIKYGGAAMKDNKLKDKVIDDIIFLSSIGLRIVLVHGGGPIINSWLNKVNIEPKFIDGLRVTDYETMEVVEMVLSGKVNKELVALINRKKNCAVGLSGKDANLFIASKLNALENDYVGKIETVNLELINILLDNGYIPVINSVACNDFGETYNINADTVAGAIAESLAADRLILLTDLPGILLDLNDMTTLVRHLNLQKINDLKITHVISGGMIPKVDCCVNALKKNVQSAHIIDGRVQHALLLDILTEECIGSILTL